MQWANHFFINQTRISLDSPAYFIADIAANHDGDLSRAKELIWLAKSAGANCAKFQHFQAEKIVSDYGFRHLPVGQQGHQAKWQKSVFEVYKQYECQRDWTQELVEAAHAAQIDFMTAAYDYEAVDSLEPYLPAYKIGSGDITWIDLLRHIARKNKPVLLACGASSMEDVERALSAILEYNPSVVLMQCNTNYTSSAENLKHVNLRVLSTFAQKYPEMILGLSDHTFGYVSVLGAIALGARVIEKHFTDDNSRIGPDHLFAMNPIAWKEMVDRSRELESAMGDGIKRVEENEKSTVIIQRRGLWLTRALQKGEVLQASDIEMLRPSLENGFKPYELNHVLGSTVNKDKGKGAPLLYDDIVSTS